MPDDVERRPVEQRSEVDREAAGADRGRRRRPAVPGRGRGDGCGGGGMAG